jgi:hypothetical protein
MLHRFIIDLYHIAAILVRKKRFYPASGSQRGPPDYIANRWEHSPKLTTTRILTGKNKGFISLVGPHSYSVIKIYRSASFSILYRLNIKIYIFAAVLNEIAVRKHYLNSHFHRFRFLDGNHNNCNIDV